MIFVTLFLIILCFNFAKMVFLGKEKYKENGWSHIETFSIEVEE